MNVSVIIPTYNRSNKVVRAVESVINQSLQPAEIIVVDDGSTDDTSFRLSSYASKVKLIRKSNGGVSSARNVGVLASSCELVAFLDSDDLWMEEKLARQLPLMDDPSVVLSFTGWRSSHGGGKNALGVDAGESQLVNQPIGLMASPGAMPILLQTCIVRRSAYLRVGGCDERMRLAEDTRLLFRLAFEGKFAFHRSILLEQYTGDSADRLTQLRSEAFRRMHHAMMLEVLMESYARVGELTSVDASHLRRLLAHFLAAQGRDLARCGKYQYARRRAWESICLSLNSGLLDRAFVALVAPQAFQMFRGRSAN